MSLVRVSTRWVRRGELDNVGGETLRVTILVPPLPHNEVGDHRLMTDPPDRSILDRLLAGFAFSQDEPAHAERVLAEHPQMVQLLGKMMAAMHQGLLEGIPVLERQDKRTLLVALVNRSFKCLNVAITSGLRGYYLQSVILVRSVHEDNLLFAALDTSAATVRALYAGDERWFMRGEGRWAEVAKRLDTLAASQGLPSTTTGQGWFKLYRMESVLAHPRLQALLAEFADGGTRLKAGVEWDADGCRRALGGALTAGRLALALQRSLIPVSDCTRAWHAMSVAIVTDASAWVREEIQRMRIGDPA